MNTLSLTTVPEQVGSACACNRQDISHRLSRCAIKVSRLAAAAYVTPSGPDQRAAQATVERLQRDLDTATTALDAGDYDAAARVGFRVRVTLATLGVN